VLAIVVPLIAGVLLIASVVAMYYIGRAVMRRFWRPRAAA
jgi:formate hydrogenlyase subunit 3/multisubunit Na+/H+ antiporter MnhD subunit